MNIYFWLFPYLILANLVDQRGGLGYVGTWWLQDKGESYDDFLKLMKVGWFVKTAAGLITPEMKLDHDQSGENLKVELHGPLGYSKELELRLNPNQIESGCKFPDQFELFGEVVNTCATENNPEVNQ